MADRREPTSHGHILHDAVIPLHWATAVIHRHDQELQAAMAARWGVRAACHRYVGDVGAACHHYACGLGAASHGYVSPPIQPARYSYAPHQDSILNEQHDSYSSCYRGEELTGPLFSFPRLCRRTLRVAVADGEGPLPHDPWFRVLTRNPLTYAHELPYKVRGEANTRIHTSGSWPVNERIYVYNICVRTPSVLLGCSMPAYSLHG